MGVMEEKEYVGVMEEKEELSACYYLLAFLKIVPTSPTTTRELWGLKVCWVYSVSSVSFSCHPTPNPSHLIIFGTQKLFFLFLFGIVYFFLILILFFTGP